jgi:hypothetical protein
MLRNFILQVRYTISNQVTNTTELTDLELAKFILSRILKNQNGVDQMEKELDSNERLVSEIVYFFIDIGWVRRNINGTYAITTKCKSVIE